MDKTQGWSCPVCKTVHAPDIKSCKKCTQTEQTETTQQLLQE